MINTYKPFPALPGLDCRVAQLWLGPHLMPEHWLVWAGCKHAAHRLSNQSSASGHWQCAAGTLKEVCLQHQEHRTLLEPLPDPRLHAASDRGAKLTRCLLKLNNAIMTREPATGLPYSTLKWRAMQLKVSWCICEAHQLCLWSSQLRAPLVSAVVASHGWEPAPSACYLQLMWLSRPLLHASEYFVPTLLCWGGQWMVNQAARHHAAAGRRVWHCQRCVCESMLSA